LIVPDFEFHGREIHSRLIREERPIAGVNHLGELPDKLRRTVLLIDEKIPSGATVGGCGGAGEVLAAGPRQEL